MKPIRYTGLYCVRCGRRQEEQHAKGPCVTPKCNSGGFTNSLRLVPWSVLMKLQGNRKFLRELRIGIGAKDGEQDDEDIKEDS